MLLLKDTQWETVCIFHTLSRFVAFELSSLGVSVYTRFNKVQGTSRPVNLNNKQHGDIGNMGHYFGVDIALRPISPMIAFPVSSFSNT